MIKNRYFPLLCLSERQCLKVEERFNGRLLIRPRFHLSRRRATTVTWIQLLRVYKYLQSCRRKPALVGCRLILQHCLKVAILRCASLRIVVAWVQDREQRHLLNRNTSCREVTSAAYTQLKEYQHQPAVNYMILGRWPSGSALLNAHTYSFSPPYHKSLAARPSLIICLLPSLS